MVYRLFEEDLFKVKTVSIAIPVNMEGVAGRGLALYAKNTYPGWFEAYRESCLSGEIQEKGYFLFQRGFETSLVAIPTKYKWRENSDWDLIVSSLMAFERDFDITEGFHWINELRLPALGCGNGNLEWNCCKEEKLEKLLRDTKVTYTFCIESFRRPNSYYEEIDYRNKMFYFKGDGILGILGSSGKIRIDGNEYLSVLDYVYYHLSLFLELKEEDYDLPNFEFSGYIKRILSDYVRDKGLVLPNGINLITEASRALRRGITERLHQDSSLRAELLRVKNLFEGFHYKIVYCGYEFPRITGINLDLSDSRKENPENWRGRNLVGEILMELTEQL